MTSPPPRAGELSPRAKLTEADVVRIRAMRTAGVKLLAIHAEFPNVSWTVVVMAANKRSWKHVPWWREWTDVYGEGWKT